MIKTRKKEENLRKRKISEQEYAQVGIRIRVDCVTGNHDRPLHYLGIDTVSPASQIRTGDIAVAAQLP